MALQSNIAFTSEGAWMLKIVYLNHNLCVVDFMPSNADIPILWHTYIFLEANQNPFKDELAKYHWRHWSLNRETALLTMSFAI